MPRSTREWAHRKIDMAIGNLETVVAHLEEVREVYEVPHSDIAEHLQQMQFASMVVRDALDKIKGAF